MRPLLAFAAAVLVFHNLPAAAEDLGDWIDLVTPFAVLAPAAAVLGLLRPPPWVWAVAIAAGIAYTDGHGIHLAANSIRSEGLTGTAEDTAYFWDERFGHVEWHLGLIGLLVAFALAERFGRGAAGRLPLAAVLVALLLGFTLFTSTVEGQDWWLVPPVAAAFAAWGLLRRAPVLEACAGALAVAGLLMAAWAAWHRGMPEFSDLGWI